MRVIQNSAGGECLVLDDGIANEPPDITINIICYNHEKYIRHALDSVLEQQTRFTYEIVVSDDCSKDTTQNIILEYKERYPERIIALLHKKNQGAMKNVSFAKQFIRGRYIASLEGDDFWTYSGKLENQVGFLEENPSYFGSAHNCGVCDEDENPVSIPNRFPRTSGDVDFSDALKYVICFHTSTVVRRNIEFPQPEMIEEIRRIHPYVGDQFARLLWLDQGPFYLFPGSWSTYRLIIKRTGSNAQSWGNVHKVRSAALLLKQALLIQGYFGQKRNIEERIAYNTFCLLYAMVSSGKNAKEDRQLAHNVLCEVSISIKIRAVLYAIKKFYRLFRKKSNVEKIH